MEKQKTAKKPLPCIFKDIASCGGSGESSRIYMSTDLATGESELIIEKTITERYPTKDYERVMDLFDRLNCGSGRKVYSLNEIAHPYNPNPR